MFEDIDRIYSGSGDTVLVFVVDAADLRRINLEALANAMRDRKQKKEEGALCRVLPPPCSSAF